MAKILSSRSTEPGVDELTEELSELLFCTLDLLGRGGEELPTDLDEIMIELDQAILELGIEHVEMAEAMNAMGIDLISFAVANTGLAIELKRAGSILEALSSSLLVDEDALSSAMSMLKNEGEAVSYMSGSVQFDSEDDLRKALLEAIMHYNSEVGNKMLSV